MLYICQPHGLEAENGKQKEWWMAELSGGGEFRPGEFQSLLTSSPTPIDGGLGARGKPVEGLERNGG
jgi:hypothetical protein